MTESEGQKRWPNSGLLFGPPACPRCHGQIEHQEWCMMDPEDITGCNQAGYGHAWLNRSDVRLETLCECAERAWGDTVPGEQIALYGNTFTDDEAIEHFYKLTRGHLLSVDLK
jgi:hypothetical protein